MKHIQGLFWAREFPAIKIVPMGAGSQRIFSQNYLLAAAAGITLLPWPWHICLM